MFARNSSRSEVTQQKSAVLPSVQMASDWLVLLLTARSRFGTPPPLEPTVRVNLDKIEGSLERPGYRAIAYPRPQTVSGEIYVGCDVLGRKLKSLGKGRQQDDCGEKADLQQ